MSRYGTFLHFGQSDFVKLALDAHNPKVAPIPMSVITGELIIGREAKRSTKKYLCNKPA